MCVCAAKFGLWRTVGRFCSLIYHSPGLAQWEHFPPAISWYCRAIEGEFRRRLALMSSLADLPELVGFFSYSREDDADSQGALSALRSRIQGELRGQLGRTAKTFRLWQDKEAIPSGTLWESEINNSIRQAVFFIPIITPTVVASPYCRFELDAFLARESALGRSDLVFPILYIHVPALEDSVRRQNDAVLSLIAKRQYVDWREFRHLDSNSTEVRRAVERFCTHIRDALHKSWVSPEERKHQGDAAAQARAEAELQRREAEAKRRAEEETRQRTAKEEVGERETEAEQRRAEAERGGADERRLREEAEARQRVEKEERRRDRHSQARRPSRSELAAAFLLGVVLLGLIAWLTLSPTPAPVMPAPPPAANPPIDTSLCKDKLCGTTWGYTDVNSNRQNCPLIFKPSSEVSECDSPGTYSIQGDTIRFSVNDDYAQFQGTIDGTRMSGTATNIGGGSWTWSAVER
jgi:TIR domain